MIFAQAPQSAPPPAAGASPFEQLPLRDIHLPAEPSLWPLAPGWWVVIAIAAIILSYLGWRLIRHLKRLAFIRRVRSMLEENIAAARDDGSRIASEVSMLLRRAALIRYPTEQVASLAGQPWLEFLDRTGGGGGFCDGPGRVLAEGPWRPHSEVNKEGLKQVANRWLEANL